MFCKEGLQVQSTGEHRKQPGRVARPFVTRTVPIELKSVTVGVAKVNCLADAVVGRLIDTNAVSQQPAEGVGEIHTRRIKRCRRDRGLSHRVTAVATRIFPGV